MADLASTRVFGRLTVMHEAILRANAELAGATMSDRLVIDNSSYDRHILLKRGSLEFPITITTAGSGRGRLMGGDWEVSSGDLLVDGTISGDGSGLTGTANNLRARATTKADVGLSNVRNVDAYAKSDFSSDDDANAPMVRNGSGDVWCRLFRSSFSTTNSNIAGIYTTREIGGDYMRPSTPSQVKSALNLSKSDVGLSNIPNSTTSSRTSSSSSSLLQARAMNDHRTSGDHDSRYVRKSGDTISGSSGLEFTNDEWGAIRQGAYSDGRGNTSNAEDMSIWTRFRSSSGSRDINTVFRDAGGLTCYGPSDTGEILSLSDSGNLNIKGSFSGDASGLSGSSNNLRARATTKADVGLSDIPNSTTASRTSSSSSSLLQARAMNDHRTSGDHDSRYARKSGDSVTAMEFTGEGSVSYGNSSQTNYDAAQNSHSSRFMYYIDSSGEFSNGWGLRTHNDGSSYNWMIRVNHDGEVIASYFTGDGSGLTGTSSMRATGTTKGDVGLGSVRNEDIREYGLGSLDLDDENNIPGDDISQVKYAGFFATNSGGEPYGHSSGISIPYRRDDGSGNQIGHYIIFDTGENPKASIATYRNGSFKVEELLHRGNSDTFNSSGSYSNLRARSTTKGDVGLSNVANVDQRNASNLTSGTVPDARLPSNARGSRTVSTSEPSGGSDGDIWLKY